MPLFRQEIRGRTAIAELNTPTYKSFQGVQACLNGADGDGDNQSQVWRHLTESLHLSS